MTTDEPTDDVVVHPWWPRGWRAVALAALAVLFLVLGVVQARADSLTPDEGADLTAGLTALVHRDARMVPEHPVLPKVLVAAPALLGRPVVPASPAWRRGESFDHAEEIVVATRAAGRFDRVLLLGRLVPLALAVACALVIHALGARLFGPDAGAAGAALWLGLPVVLGFGHLATIDIPFSLATLLVALGSLRLLERPGERRAAELGALVGVALATRHTGLVLAVVAVGLTVWALRRDRRQAAVAVALLALCSLAVLWGVYRAVAPSAPAGAARAQLEGVEAAASEESAAARLVAASPTPLEWRAGFAYLVLTSDDKPSYLFGQAWTGGRWWYFPGSLLVKVPAPALVLLVAGPLALRHHAVGLRRRVLTAVVLPAGLLLAFTMAQPLTLGVRLVLPVVALLLVAASAAAAAPQRWVRASVAGVVALQVVAMVASAPHSIAWTTPPFRPAYRWASDSNVDYGQDRDRLADWARGRDAWVSLGRARGIPRPAGTRPLLEADPAALTGWVAVGVSDLTRTHRDELAWLRRWCPVDTIGGSILIYRFDAPPGPTPGPDRPVADCFGAARSHR